MLVPETRYARSGEVSIAYQVFGRGDVDLVVLSTFWNQIEHHWELPSFARALERLGSFARVVMLDKRGSGLSDRVTGTPSAEERMEDIHAVMDAVGVDRPALLGASEGTLSALFAATYPQQTEALIIYGSSACWADSISETDLAPSMPTLTTAGEAATSLGSSRRLWLTTRALGAGSLGLSA
jgi:pimeloyl-ACP methyl ester carboxylesterase